MIGAILALLLVSAGLVVAALLAGQPGAAEWVWLGWEVRTTAAFAIILAALSALAFVILWRTVLFIAEAPGRASRDRAEARRRQGLDAVTRGFLAAAAGDGSEARRLAQKAALLVDDDPALVRILAAQAAEAANDPVAAQAAYSAMLGFPDMRLAGHRGLMRAALDQGDRAGALRHAQAAFDLSRSPRWAWRALLDDRIAEGDWGQALALVEAALDRKIASPVIAQRARAALLAASAASLEATDPAHAQEWSAQAARLQPDFTPGAVLAARLMASQGKRRRAAGLIASAWKAAPHPALWLAYRDLEPRETPANRAARLRRLASRNREHRESRILMVEQALIARDPIGARDEARRLDSTAPTARECGLMARVSRLAGDLDEAAGWAARAPAAPADPDWSDIDPEGKAFAYAPTDWARLVSTYAQSGELAHPRHDRRERVMTDLPETPAGYHPSQPYIAALRSGARSPPAPDDPGSDAASNDAPPASRP